MALVDIRQRSGYLFLVVTLGQILLISAQVNTKSGVPVIERVTFGVFSEVQRGFSGGLSGVRNVWSGYVGLRNMKAENDALKRDLASAQIAVQEQRALADRTRGLQRLLELREQVALKTVAANIIGGAATPDFRTLTIDRGTRDGVRTDMAVIAPGGVVGRLVVPSARAAKVQLLIDRNAAAGAIIERTRAQGVVVGSGDDRLRLEYVSEVSDVVAGDVVVTSGIDGIYPKGFIIGRIEQVEKSGGSYKRITIKPAVDFTSLEEVLVVLAPSQARDAAEGPSE
ncbi:MAG TPA: rod shape-determining protein MreC [Vicinamibacterales bacterium]|jgi:rod shape-determining protein MreC|nr:rod shape-determining protein MreC [Vicinamibacterales bacterium]